jgi:hypothetical protein
LTIMGFEDDAQAMRMSKALFASAGRDVMALVNDDHVPPSVLEVITVFEVAFKGIDQDALTRAALDELGGQNTRCKRFAQTHGVGDQDARAVA